MECVRPYIISRSTSIISHTIRYPHDLSFRSSPTRRVRTHKDVIAETRVITALILLLLHVWIEWLVEVGRVELEGGVNGTAILDVRVPSIL